MSQNIVVQNNVMKDVDVKQLAKAVAEQLIGQLEADFQLPRGCKDHPQQESPECLTCTLLELTDRRIAAALKAALGSGSDD